MEINAALTQIKEELKNTIDQIQKAKSIQRKKQLIKHKHRLEKEVMTYMYYRYGVVMKKSR